MNLANAIIYGEQEIVEALLKSGVDVNDYDDYGFTPLIESAIADNKEIAELLVKNNADVNQRDVTGGSALHWAAENNNKELCKLLLDRKADPNAYNDSKQPVLLKPLLRHNTAVKRLLYHHGADLNFALDYINTKLLGHRYELIGRIDIVDPNGKFVELNLEGFILEFTLGILQESLNHFRNNYAARHLRHYFKDIQKVIDALATSADLIKYQQYMIDIEQHKKRIDAHLKKELLIIPIGYEGHAITFIKYGNLFARCDRGEYSIINPSVTIFHVTKPEKLNEEFFKELIYKKQRRHYIDSGIVKTLGLVPVDTIPLPSQLTGNCSWANVESVLPTVLYMLALAETSDKEQLSHEKESALNIYDHWRDWDKDWALGHCIDSFYYSNKARKASKVAILAAILFQRCDYRNEQDMERAHKILAILATPEYEYVIKSYIEIYINREKTKAGMNFAQLLDICGYTPSYDK